MGKPLRRGKQTWNKQGSWPTADGAKGLPGPPFLCRRGHLVRMKVSEESTEVVDSTERNYQQRKRRWLWTTAGIGKGMDSQDYRERT